MVQNLDKIVARMVQNGGLEGVWRGSGEPLGGSRVALGRQGTFGLPPGSFLGRSWAVPEPSWAPLGRLLGVLGAKLGRLGASWRRHGRIFMAKWDQ